VTQHLSSLEIDEIASGLLDDARARAHLEACPRCRDDLATAGAARAEFERSVFPRTVEKLRPQRRRWLLVPALSLPIVAAIAVMLWLGHREPTADDDIRIKGGPTFRVFAKRGESVFAVRDGTRLAPGDHIRFVAGSRGPAYLLIASVDGAGSATVYYPYGGDRSERIAADARELPGSIVLDDAPGPERVFALFSDQPLDAPPVLRTLRELGARGPDAIRQTGTLDLPCVQATLVFDKVNR
jgi:hypothetical protein